MAITATQNNGSGVVHFANGSYIDTGTAAAFTITTGFQPRYVKVVNVAATGSQVEWFEGMTDAYGMKRVTAGDMTYITSLGITPLSYGFTVGLDADLNVSSEQLHWICLG